MAGLISQVSNMTGIAQETLRAREAYQLALNDLQARRTRTLQDFGFSADTDPETGALKNVMVDKFNRHGFLQNMLRGHAEQQIRTDQQRVSRGLGRRGLGQQAGSSLRVQQDFEKARFGAGLTDTLAGFRSQQTRMKSDFDRTLGELTLRQAREDILNRNFNIADFGELGEFEMPDFPEFGQFEDFDLFEDLDFDFDDPQLVSENPKAYAFAMKRLKAAQAMGLIDEIDEDDPAAQWRSLSGTLSPFQQKRLKRIQRGRRGKRGRRGSAIGAGKKPKQRKKPFRKMSPREKLQRRRKQLKRAKTKKQRAKLRGQIKSLNRQVKRKRRKKRKGGN